MWAFVGDGPRRGEVEGFAREHPGARIALHPPVAPRELPGSLAAGDVHLIGMAPGWEGLIVPSRLQAAFAAVEAARDPSERARRGMAARTFALERFDRARNCGRVGDLVEEAATGALPDARRLTNLPPSKVRDP